ncbi:hypothetical protein MASR2M15_13920 [Anaerolineales bacterium]
MSPSNPSSLPIKPAVDTKLHIDYEWWNRSEDDLRVYLISHLPVEQRDRLQSIKEDRLIDYIDPITAEVTPMDELGTLLRQASQDPDFINSQISLVDCVFRVFLKNNNTPLSSLELADITERPASLILKTLSGRRIYRGIRPILG